MGKINHRPAGMAILLLLAFMGCGKVAHTYYDGPNYILFSDTLKVLGVQNNEDYFDIPITATQTCKYDRTVAVEVIDKKSNAIEGKHYTIESNSITIKAGERVGNVRIRGRYDAIEATDSIGLTLHLITRENDKWKLYDKNYEQKIILKKCCPFDINIFNGYAVLTSTYLYQFVKTANKRLIKTEVDPKESNTIIMKDYFYDGYDVKIRFKTDDVLNPLIEMDEQVFASTADAFGTKYGDGFIHLYQPPTQVSYYSTCEKFIMQYFTLYVPGMSGQNVVGNFIGISEWVSDDVAKRIYIERGMQISETAQNNLKNI